MPSDFKVSVKVDATPREDLIKVLEDMRQEYESIMKKKNQDFDTWFREQVRGRGGQTARTPVSMGLQC